MVIEAIRSPGRRHAGDDGRQLLQVALWGWLFVLLGQFESAYAAIYHSAVNFTSLGYGDVVMGAEWKLLGPLEAANGVLMMSMTAAALTAILQNTVRSQADAKQ